MSPKSNPVVLHIAMVDDQEADRQKLMAAVEDFCSRTKGISCEITSCQSGEEMRDAFTPERFDLAFLDIQMKGINGIALAEQLRAEDTHLLIVFLTSSREYAFDAFPVHPFDYLTKPFTQETLDALLNEVLRVLHTAEPEIAVHTARGTLTVPFRSVTAVVARGHSVECNLTDGRTLKGSHTFKEMESALTQDKRFLLCNRGILINMDHVASLTDSTFRMQDGKLYPLRIKGQHAIVSQFSQYMISRMEARRPKT